MTEKNAEGVRMGEKGNLSTKSHVMEPEGIRSAPVAAKSDASSHNKDPSFNQYLMFFLVFILYRIVLYILFRSLI